MNLTAPKELVSVQDRARRYLAKCPPAIDGQHGHNATFRVACILVHGFALGETDALSLLRGWNASCQPPWSEAELVHKIESALGTPPKDPPGHLLGGSESVRATSAASHAAAPGPPMEPTARLRKVDFNPETLKRVAAGAGPVDETYLKERSPLCPETQTPVTFLQHLYRLGEQVLVFDRFKSQGCHLYQRVQPPVDARNLDHFLNGRPEGVWFLCNPVDGFIHPKASEPGKLSRRSKESVTSWRYLVLESDAADPDQWLAVLVQLPLRMAAVYTSAGRSIHALVQVDAKNKADWDSKAARLKRIMTILGADPKNITGVRLTRLPGCHRGQQGPPAPLQPLVYPRWVDEPLEYDKWGDPIWVPPHRPAIEPPSHLWTGGRLQELLYLNPNPDSTPIQARPIRPQMHEEWPRRELTELHL